ncbi:hypothetical protein OGCDGJMD_02819 [Cyanobium usitatum str. Tous]|nr:hypothetical protein OGCDGJMD_02819 [Cyanobium usitatum str. Tous]
MSPMGLLPVPIPAVLPMHASPYMGLSMLTEPSLSMPSSLSMHPSLFMPRGPATPHLS